MKDLVLVKLGGSLITDKRRESHPRLDVLARLAEEIASAIPEMSEQLIVGHGSGSFGHVAAARHGIGHGPLSPEAVRGASETGHAARQLHGLVTGSLLSTQLSPFSWSPGSAVVSRAGRAASGELGPLLAALELGMLPVVYGDVVMDRDWGAAICSTEDVLRYLVGRLKQRDWRIRRVLWLGATEGIYDSSGASIPEIRRPDYPRVRKMIGETEGTDVTGGMLLRLETARWLAIRGIESWILDGRSPTLLKESLLGRQVPGTRFVAEV